jgi:lipid intermediate transporter
MTSGTAFVIIYCSTLTRSSYRYSRIPLCLLYSSVTKLFLLLLLSIWRPHMATQGESIPWYANEVTEQEYHPLVASALRFFDEDKLDREWVVRTVLGGMSAGFGLRGVSS